MDTATGYNQVTSVGGWTVSQGQELLVASSS